MFVGVLSMRLRIHGARSLKEKRRVVLQVKERVKGRFNCAVAEVGDQDLWQAATLGFSVVSENGAVANSVLDQIADFVESIGTVEVIDRFLEILSVRES